jgi:hypothetical protein
VAKFSREVRTGTFEALGLFPLKTWTGWVIFGWEMGHVCYLRKKRPRVEYFHGEACDFDITDAIESVNPEFLKACGITIPWDVTDAEGVEFYYGRGCHRGYHPPIRISLTLPEPLLDQLGLS